MSESSRERSQYIPYEWYVLNLSELVLYEANYLIINTVIIR